MATKKVNKKTEDSKIVRASARHVRLSPRKIKLVLELVKGKQAEPALQVLQFSPKKGAVFIKKLLESALANAREKGGIEIDNLWVTGGYIDMGRTLKRYMPGAHGRANLIKKRSAHVSIELSEK